jgi:hypothetical protein
MVLQKRISSFYLISFTIVLFNLWLNRFQHEEVLTMQRLTEIKILQTLTCITVNKCLMENTFNQMNIWSVESSGM